MTRRWTSLAAVLTYSFAISFASASPSSRPTACKAGDWSSRAAAAVTLEGLAQWQGLQVRASLAVDRKGRLAVALAGELPMARGVNEQRVWAVDYLEAARTLQWREADEWRLLAAVLNGQRPDDASVQQDGSLSASPLAKRLPHTLDTDAVTGNPSELRYQRGNETQVVEFGSWQRFGALCAPSELRFIGPMSLRLRLERPRRGQPLEFEPPTPDGQVARFDSAQIPELQVRKTSTGHLLVKPLIDGRDLGWFIFDTGAGITVLDTRAAAHLGLRPFGRVDAIGNGGKEAAAYVRPSSLQLGPLQLTQPFAIVLDLSGITSALGEQVAGIVGFNLIHRSVVQVDAAVGAIALHDPSRFQQDLPWQAMALVDRRPVVEAEFEGKPGRFMLDSGAGHTFVSFSAPAVEKHKLLENRPLRDSQSAGVGGARPEKLGTLQSFVLGGRRYTGVPAQFKLPAAVPTGDHDPSLVGVIGGGLLRIHQVTMDYPNARITFVSRLHPAPKPPAPASAP